MLGVPNAQQVFSFRKAEGEVKHAKEGLLAYIGNMAHCHVKCIL